MVLFAKMQQKGTPKGTQKLIADAVQKKAMCGDWGLSSAWPKLYISKKPDFASARPN